MSFAVQMLTVYLQNPIYNHLPSCVLADNNLEMLIFDKYLRIKKYKLLVCQASDTAKVCGAIVQISPWIEDFPSIYKWM
jgi:hypothetical protein